MANKKFAEFKVGTFVFIATFVVILTIFWAKGFTVSISQQDYVAYFPRISGLNEGDQVSVNGVRKGKIDRIELAGDSVKIEFSIDKSIKIKKDYNIYVAFTELTGGKVLYIEPGDSAVEVEINKPLHGNTGADFSSMMNSFSDITTDVKDLISEFKKSTDNLNEVIHNVNEIVGDGNLKRDLKSTLSNLEVSSRNLNQLVSESRTGISRFTSKAGNTFDNIDVIVGENSKELKNTLTEIQILTITVDTLVSNLNSVVLDIQNKKGIGKFLADEKIFDNINNTLTEIEKLTKKIRRDGVKINLF